MKDSDAKPQTARLAWEDELRSGKLERSTSVFRHVIASSDGDEAQYPPEGNGRYHLYLSKACPWASRIEIAVRLTGLIPRIGMTFVDPIFQPIGEGRTGWVFSKEFPDDLTHKATLYEVYLHYHPDFTGKATTPMLLDTKTKTIVSNESKDILKSICWGFRKLHAPNTPDYFPMERLPDYESWLGKLYDPLLNGVYKVGFTTSQSDYDAGIKAMFDVLDEVDAHLGKNKWMLGDEFSVVDLILGVTLCRFDAVYYVHFMCCKKHIHEYEHLSNYVRCFYQQEHVKASADLESCKQHYFQSHHVIAPNKIVAVGNANSSLDLPHNREELFPSPTN
uniref:GST C-terminal domain-containing protein n=1 Tax=Craspedostauros australis TaxID=1486917 RepID=A0A7R9WTA5_9STRA|mmetsp:Transcript_18435/g.51208  ORF Transcript_18435/g.51208 Transcript_18435/m.51208 type:complete len:334 (+) Transcript_18435:278-1279(+)|eukprot:CAMPEP_0198116048 /NCGR_PEP_ID=MMETSP1442-20131203/9418_1 /TAXON_ID= /ORGANISM="Craspedostauros australis, Strain CCMP3328" /LENGTH=333 /DNA_ID=CAMNT_0043773731 /DNA_START=261 /DNA_END=1262 /DNA_ORIENTATION=+